MSLLKRFPKGQHSADRILRRLLEKLHDSGELRTQIETILEEEAITLSEEERLRIEETPVDYLLGLSPFERIPGEDPEIALKRCITRHLLSRGFVADLREPAKFEELFRRALEETGVRLPELEQRRLLESLRQQLID
jgi:hypothetical protein